MFLTFLHGETEDNPQSPLTHSQIHLAWRFDGPDQNILPLESLKLDKRIFKIEPVLVTENLRCLEMTSISLCMLSWFSHIQLWQQQEEHWNHAVIINTGSSVHGILQARILEWVAISSSRKWGSSWPRDWTLISYVSCIGKWFPYH